MKILDWFRPSQTTTTTPDKMNPATIALIVTLIEEAIKLEPQLAAELATIFSKPNPTPDDWAALRAKVKGETFEALAPAAAANLQEVAPQPTVTEQAAPVSQDTPPATPPVPTSEVAKADAPVNPDVVCPSCGKILVANSPDNCNC
jgi:hypothetical protein